MRCFRHWKLKFNINPRCASLTSTVGWIRKRPNCSKLQRMVLYASLSSLVYNIWINRNKTVWENTCENHEKFMDRGLRVVSDRVRFYLPKKVSSGNKLWLNDIGIACYFFLFFCFTLTQYGLGGPFLEGIFFSCN